MFASGSNFYVDTSYIERSDYLKNWECAPDNKVYVEIKAEESTVIVSYDADDIDGGHEFEGSNDDEEDEPQYSGGQPVYGCEVIPDEIRDWIRDALNLVKYVALAIVIVLGILDFLKAAGSGEAETMKKSGTNFVKRIIAVIILFLVPLIVDLILNLIEIFGADSTCI